MNIILFILYLPAFQLYYLFIFWLREIVGVVATAVSEADI